MSVIELGRAFPKVELRFAAATDVGLVRQSNEDTFLVWHCETTQLTPTQAFTRSRGLFAVCDGMGGHASGEVAANIAINAWQTQLMPLALAPELPSGDIAARLAQMVREGVNSAVLDLNRSLPEATLKRMGTTLVGLLIFDNRAWRVHVGDCRLYRITLTEIDQATEDHNIGTRDVKRGTATMLEAFRSPVGKHLTQALGPKDSEFVSPDSAEIPIDQPSALLLCSDGLSDMVPEAEIHKTVVRLWDTPDAAVSELIKQANQGGGLDNITAVLVRVDPVAAGGPALPE